MEQTIQNRRFIISVKNKIKNYYSFNKSKTIISEAMPKEEEKVKSLADKYGTSKAYFDEVRRNVFPSNIFLLIKLLEYIILIFALIYTYSAVHFKLQPYLLVFLLIALYFIGIGDLRTVGALKMIKKEYKEYCFIQAGILLFSALTQLLISFGVPMLFNMLSYSEEKKMTIGPIIKNVCLIFAVVAALFIIYGCVGYFVKARIWMSCIVIQGISLILSLYYFWDYMFRCAATGYKNFFIGAYFISFVFSLIWVYNFLPEKTKESGNNI